MHILCSNVIVYYNFTTMISHRYSRKLMWMELPPAHHNPRIICNYFMAAVAERAGNSGENYVSKPSLYLNRPARVSADLHGCENDVYKPSRYLNSHSRA